MHPGDVFDELAESGYQIHSLDGRGPHDRATYVHLCEQSHSSGYNRAAETNWVAFPTTASGTPTKLAVLVDVVSVALHALGTFGVLVIDPAARARG